MIKWKRYGWTLKDECFRRLYFKVELNKNILKCLLSSNELNKYFKLYFDKKLHSYSKKTSLSIYRKYCLFRYTGRVVFQSFKLGRHAVKSIASLGYIAGLKKSSF